MNKLLELLKYFHPISFSIVFLLIFSGIIFYVDLQLSNQKMESTLEYLSHDIRNLVIGIIGDNLEDLLSDSLVQYCFVDSNFSIKSLGINTKDTTSKINDLIIGYLKVRYSFEVKDTGLVDKSKLFIGQYPNIPIENQIHKNPNGLIIYPHLMIGPKQDSSRIVLYIEKFMNDNINIIKALNDDAAGKYNRIYLEINNFGTDKAYLPFIFPAFLKVTRDELKIPITQTYMTILRYCLFPIEVLLKEVYKNNVDFVIKKNSDNSFIYGDAIKAKYLKHLEHYREIIISLSRGNELTLCFVPDENFKRQWTFFPIVYVILIIITFLFFVTLRFFLIQIAKREIILEKSNSELVKANNTKNKFFSIIAHDLRNPIMAMSNIATVFNDYYHNMSPSEVTKSISILVKSTTHLSKMLENLLQWSRVSVGSIEINFEQQNFEQIVDVSFNDIQVQAENKNIKLIFENHYSADVICDPDMINTILRNLISNAIKFSEYGKNIFVRIEEYLSDDKFVLVTVRDEGVGMNPDTLNNLFRTDSKISTKGTAGEAGTGLGLILCKEFIDKHNCKIWVESQIGVGTKFKFTLKKY